MSNEVSYLRVDEIVNTISDTHKLNCERIYAINTSDVESGKFLNPPLIKTSELKGQFKKTIKKGDILFSEIRPANRHFAKVEFDNTESYVASTKLMVLRKFNDNVDNDYFYYWLTNTPFLNLLQRRAENRICSFPQITFDLLAEYKVPVPSLEKQQKIAKLLSKIDRKIEINNNINSELEAMAKEIYEYWFIQYDFPGEDGKPYKSNGGNMVYNEELKRKIPEGWGVKKLKDVVKHINTGLNPRQNFVLNDGGNIKYITVKNLTPEGTLDFSGCDLITKESKDMINARSEINVGDILFASIAPLGRCYLIYEEPKEREINESVFSIRANKEINPEYLYMYFMSKEFVKKSENSSTGSIFSGIRIGTLEDMNILIPEEKVLNAFSKEIKSIYQIKRNKENQNNRLLELRDFLLPMLMNGQVTVK